MQPGRYAKRSTAAVAVMLTSRDRVSRTELTLTENISGRGARVVTKTLWSANDSLVIKSLEGDLQSEARVIYRQPVRENVYGYRPEVNRTNGYLANKIQLSSTLMNGPDVGCNFLFCPNSFPHRRSRGPGSLRT